MSKTQRLLGWNGSYGFSISVILVTTE